MPSWPTPTSNNHTSADGTPTTSWAYSRLANPEVLATSALLTLLSLAGVRVYKRHLRRIPTATHIKPEMLPRKGSGRPTTLFGRVTSVGDGDNFRMYHTPGGRWAGWGWMPGRRVPTGKELTGQTIHVRIAGVDAPELAHFGRPAQPFGKEALAFLTSYLLHRRVRVYLWRRDQYERVVATVHVKRGLVPFWTHDVSMEMLRRGLATIYEAKFGAEFGGKEEEYREAEAKAKKSEIGLWKERSIWEKLLGRDAAGEQRESPREYKRRMEREDKEKASKT